MLLGTDELTILRGSKFYRTWQWVNSVTGDPEDFAGLSATIKIKNIHEDFEDIKNVFEVGTAIIEPLDVDGNATKGRVDVSLSKADTLNFTIPQSEDDKYGESGFYAILEILLSTSEVILQAKVRIVESLESETLDFLLDERDEAIIINGKLDNILLRNDEYISTRDNLIDVVIPTSLLTYNTNHDEKMGIYNSNDTSKTNTYNQNHATKLQEVNTLALNVQSNKDLVDQAKANVLAMKDDVQGNKDSVALMKTAIEAMLDNFSDRYLDAYDVDPIVDNDGNALVIGAIYYNKIAKELRFYNGVSWDSPTAAAQTYALQASQYASAALASKNAAKTSEDNAKLSEQNTQTLVNQAANNYEPKNANIQSHISNSTNPHGTTAAQVGAYSTSESDDKYNLKVNVADIIDNLTLTLTDKPLSANQGKILKGYIDSINTLLSSNDTSLDELQEIVNFIKANKSTLDALSISNIAGLVDALAAKANAIDVYTKILLDLKISYQQFDKPSKGPLFVKLSPSSIKIPAGLKLTVGTESFKIITDYTLSLATNLLIPETKIAGTDYFVYAKSDATFYISSNENIITDRKIGGFHYSLVGESEAITGNKLEADMVKIRGINQYSFWDLKYKPTANPKGMFLAGGVWYDIYLLNSEHITNGTSKAGATIAGGTAEYGRAIPKIPLEYGGNNTLTYGKFTWFQACEIGKAHGKRPVNYAEFPTVAYGVNEQKSSLVNAYETVAGKIEHYPNLTSKYGMEQATGVQWIWGSDVQGIGGDGWKTGLTDGRGDIYAYANQPTAVILGGYRSDGAYAGSRASYWYNYVWNSNWFLGCRFACDHLELE